MDNITDYRKIERDMKELWKETFHDSSRYIDIVFNVYFKPENIFVRYDKNRLTASLLCIPYEFQILTKEDKMTKLRGMYLCGLATHPDYRRRGIMSELMQEAEQSAIGRGFDISFLIPADDHLRDYYEKKGYRTSSFRRSVKAINRRQSEMPELNNYSIRNLLKNDRTEFVEQLAGWCCEKERQKKSPTLIHSVTDMKTAMLENENSIFFTKGTFDPEYPILANVVAVAFPELPDGPEQPIRIVGLYTKAMTSHREEDEELNHAILKEIEEAVSELHSGYTVKFFLPVGSISQNHEIGKEVPYAMMKCLNSNGNSAEIENLKFQICLMLD